jgi:hypothetical protein
MDPPDFFRVKNVYRLPDAIGFGISHYGIYSNPATLYSATCSPRPAGMANVLASIVRGDCHPPWAFSL